MIAGDYGGGALLTCGTKRSVLIDGDRPGVSETSERGTLSIDNGYGAEASRVATFDVQCDDATNADGWDRNGGISRDAGNGSKDAIVTASGTVIDAESQGAPGIPEGFT